MIVAMLWWKIMDFVAYRFLLINRLTFFTELKTPVAQTSNAKKELCASPESWILPWYGLVFDWL